jgi:hypothetical protein
MSTKDQRTARRLKAQEINGSHGWQAVEEELQERISIATRRLTDGTFKDLSEVTKLQAEIQTLRQVLSFVNNRFEIKSQEED